MNALMDDPEFFNYLIGNIPAGEIQAAYEQYQKDKSFAAWLDKLKARPDLMQVIDRLFTLDEMARAKEERWTVNLVIAARLPKDPAKQRTDPITTDEIIEFYKSLK